MSIVLLCVVLTLPVVVWYLACRRDYYPLPEGCTTLYLGDSHIQCGVDDSILSSSANLASAGAPMLCSYINLRSVLAGENSIERVVLSFWSATLADGSDKMALSPYFDKRLRYVTYEDFLATNAGVRELIRPIILSMSDWSGGELGGYNGDRYDKLEVDIAMHEKDIAEGKELGWLLHKKGLQYEWLLKIRELCEANDIELILLSTPTYRADRYSDHELFKQRLRDSLDGFTYVDHSYFEMSDDCYGDIGHLNRKGAIVYSSYIEKHGLLNFGEVITLGTNEGR